MGQSMLFVIIMLLAGSWGFGIGMAIAIWLLVSEPCCTEGRKGLPVMEELEFKKSA